MVPGVQKPEIYFELYQHGGLLKVTAIHGETGIEVSVFGPVGASREALEHHALTKLSYVLKKKREEAKK